MNTLLFGLALANLTSSPITAAPVVTAPEPVKMTVMATAYTPREEETDSTPWITASGKTTNEGMIAANFLPFGTKVRINGKIYTVEDRMNRKYTNAVPARIDLVFLSLEKARRFGRRTLDIEILNDGQNDNDGISLSRTIAANES